MSVNVSCALGTLVTSVCVLTCKHGSKKRSLQYCDMKLLHTYPRGDHFMEHPSEYATLQLWETVNEKISNTHST